MKNFLKNIGICIISGFATQVGMILAQEVYFRIDEKRRKRTIGFSVR